MPNADMNRLMDHARIRLPGAIDAAILVELFSVLKEFFNNSNAWQEEIEFSAYPTSSPYYADPDAYTYDLIPTRGAVMRLMAVRDAQGIPVRASMPVPGSVVLDRAPDADTTYTATVALTVTDPTTRDGYPQFPDWVLNKYFNELLDGLLGRMMSQIAKPYSSPSIAVVHLRKFKQAISAAKVESSRRNVYRAQNWRFPRSFAN
jgi:hypothetical protein